MATPVPHVALRFQTQDWDPRRTAVIVCDVWDLHHSINAVRRVQELAPRIDAFVRTARAAGATIIHAPSDCMAAYSEHPSRHRAEIAPAASHYPSGFEQWCSKIPAEEGVVYPVDQSDGGEDDDPEEHAAWAAKLAALGRNPQGPWLRQNGAIAIDPQQDYLSDRGTEIWNILQARGIAQVILLGVHTNMCVLGRPFGLRNLAAAGMPVVLVRDLTDTMYNPARWPFVSHYSGTDRVVAYIEQCICPTISSDQLLGGQPLRFSMDQRPRLVLLIAEDEYETARTLPQFAAATWERDVQIETLFAAEHDPHQIPGLEIVSAADALLVSVRRRPLLPAQLKILRQFAAANKPMLGIRTASHAFAFRDGEQPANLEAWPEFDAEVWGGHYNGHHGNEALPNIAVVDQTVNQTLAGNLTFLPFAAGGSLYKVQPLQAGTEVLWQGSIAGQPSEPVAWTFRRASGGRSFYTSLGHPQDFGQPEFRRLLYRSLYWGLNRPLPPLPPAAAPDANALGTWRPIRIPGDGEHLRLVAESERGAASSCWLRCFLRASQAGGTPPNAVLCSDTSTAAVYLNGTELTCTVREEDIGVYPLKPENWDATTLNCLVIRCSLRQGSSLFEIPPRLQTASAEVPLVGGWQMAVGDDPRLAQLALPAQFAAAPDATHDISLKPSTSRR